MSDLSPLRTIPGLVEALIACGDCGGAGRRCQCYVDDVMVSWERHEDGCVVDEACPACDGSGINPHIRTHLVDSGFVDRVQVEALIRRMVDVASFGAGMDAERAAALIVNTLAGGSDATP